MNKKTLLYKKSFLENFILLEKDFENKDLLKKTIWLGTKYTSLNKNIKEKLHNDILLDLDFIDTIISLMKIITYNDFLQMFPIEKNYDGEKYCSKDYFYVIDRLKNKDKDDLIGEDIYELLWDYHNSLVRSFLLSQIQIINYKDRLNGKQTLTDKFLDTFNIPTYKKINHNGKEYLIDIKNKKTLKVAKKYPSYLKRIK